MSQPKSSITLKASWHEQEHDRLVAYIQSQLNRVTSEKYSIDHSDPNIHLALAYQLGFLQSVLATAMMRDTQVSAQFKQAVTQHKS